MDKVGFIGYGSMGRMLVKGFVKSGALDPERMLICTRTEARLAGLPEGVKTTGSNEELAQRCTHLFICVKPLEVKGVLDQIAQFFPQDAHLISIAACVTIGDLENVFPGKITKVIPSLTSEVGSGVSLICHNGQVGKQDAEYINNLFASISRVQSIREENFEVAADLTSCAPGLIAAIFQEFAAAGTRHSSLTPEEAEAMVVSTLDGTAKLLADKQLGFTETICRVATKGGITEEGVKVLRGGLPAVFDEVFSRTLDKHETVKARVREQFCSGRKE